MDQHSQIIQNAIINTVSCIFDGDYTKICDVKKAVLHLETIYICNSSCYSLQLNDLSIQEQLAMYEDLGMIPHGTIMFFEDHKKDILSYWPIDETISAFPENLYEALLENELYIQPNSIKFAEGKVTRDMAGAYYTPSEFASKITRRALDTYIEKKTGIARFSFSDVDNDKVLSVLENIVFLDYSCGGGEFLLAVLQYFQEHVKNYSLGKAAAQLHGVDVNPIAVMIAVTRIARSISEKPDITILKQLCNNFLVGNPLLYNEQVASLEQRFENFALNRLYAENEGINCKKLMDENLFIVGNPPWEKLRFEERAFFRQLYPAISAIAQKDQRAKAIKALSVEWPELEEYYILVQQDYAVAKKLLPRHPLLKNSLVGELNTYALFAELASRLIGNNGFSAIIVKSALITSTCYSNCFRFFLKDGRLSEVFMYDNRKRIFPIDSREKFCVLFFGKKQTNRLQVHYGLTTQDQVVTSVPMDISLEEIEQINPETGLLPNVANKTEFAFLLRVHREFPVFSEVFPQCHFGRLVHLTAHAEHISKEPAENRVPIYEGKFIGQYDNRFATFAGVDEQKCYQPKASALRQIEDGFVIHKPIPKARYYIEEKFWNGFLNRYSSPYSLCWRSLTSPTNQRTMIASIMPTMPTCQSVQMLQTKSTEELLLILALFNSKAFDYFVRLKMAGIDLTQSVVRQIPIPTKEAWEQHIELGHQEYPAAEAVMMLEKLIYRNESMLDPLWEGIPDIPDVTMRYHNSTDIQKEMDEIIFTLYQLTPEERKVIIESFAD